jgi:hypothetical protein
VNEDEWEAIEPTDLELEEIESLDDLVDDPIHYAISRLELEDSYEGQTIDLHTQISFKGVRLA